MSESATAVKLIAVLAVVILLASLMGIGAASPFQALQDTVAAGPVLPEFDNPFLQTASFGERRAISSNGDHLGLGAPAGTVGCDSADWWECVRFNDQNESYVILDESDTSFVVTFTNSILTYGQIVDVAVTMVCSSSNSGVQADRLNTPSFFIESDRGVFEGEVLDPAFLCPAFPDWGTVTISMPGIPGADARWDESGDIESNWQIWVLDNGMDNAVVDEQTFITFVQAEVISHGEPPCTGNWFENTGCQLGQFFGAIVKGFQFVINGIIFGVSYIAAWAIWFGTVIGAFVTGIVGLATWFLDLEAPAAIQGFFGIITVTVISFFFLVVARLVRG